MGSRRPYVRFLKRLNSDEQIKVARINFGNYRVVRAFLLSHLAEKAKSTAEMREKASPTNALHLS